MDVEGAKIPVCKTFFLDTLGYSDQFVFTAISKEDEGGHCAPDMRGRHAKQTTGMKEEKERVRAHIALFPTVESHYCRKDSKRRYLGATMYRLYREQSLQEKALTIYSSTRYCEIFRT
ncbi:DNA-directed RNA polymerase 3, chloroplastic [Elysia marginata]|uniref:DNA-directed RNA polymerase 3, chloroplastic n=1 Tax=Elysia marginata TaxID=1093978 RepID=A0AAV4EX47_9GAST|nr:DNA-directed RNA polymerase 3, chloroplastic [Elysia marginata]